MDINPKLRNLVGDIALEAAFCGRDWEDLPAHVNQLRQSGLTAAEEAQQLSRLLAATQEQIRRALAVIQLTLNRNPAPPDYAVRNNMAVVELLLTDPDQRVPGLAE